MSRYITFMSDKPLRGDAAKRLRRFCGGPLNEFFVMRQDHGAVPTSILILSGRRCSRSWNVSPDVPYFEPCLVKDNLTYVIPSMSAWRWWGDEDNQLLAAAFFKRLRQAVELGGDILLAEVCLAGIIAEEMRRVF